MMKDFINRLINRKSPKERKLSKEIVISDGVIMRRLLTNKDFKRYIELLQEGEAPLLEKVLDPTYKEERDLLTARINQIEDCVKLPGHLVWRMENLPEIVRAKRKKRQKETNKKPA